MCPSNSSALSPHEINGVGRKEGFYLPFKKSFQKPSHMDYESKSIALALHG
jgi:hypothetical protein